MVYWYETEDELHSDEVNDYGNYNEEEDPPIEEPDENLKYPPGTKLKVLCGNFEHFKRGDILIVELSRKYPGSYAFKGVSDEGWEHCFIEDKTNFKVVPTKITDWKKRIK